MCELRLSIALLAVLSLASLPASLGAACYRTLTSAQYPNCQLLSPTYALHWEVSDGSIHFAVDVDGTWEWVGVGISEGGMVGADILVVAYDDDKDKWTAKDYFSPDFVTPTLDPQQDVQLIGAQRAGGFTTVQLQRKLDTCDNLDSPVLFDVQQNVIWAYGAAWGYHGNENRGSFMLLLNPNTTQPSPTPSQPPTLSTFSLTMNNYSIPTVPTTYECMNFALPSDQKYHIYQYEPIITSPLVHHIVAYACQSTPETVNQTYDCLRDMPANCNLFYLMWAPGVGTVQMPEEAALPMGLGAYQYLNLQIHYTNVQGLQGQVDSSGFKISYSPVLRPHDMGILVLGTDEIEIPPHQASWSTTPNICPAACTKQLSQPLTLYSAFLHMHQAGSAMVTQHVRDGVELQPLAYRDHYNFNYQTNLRVMSESRTLMPGDVLITTCTYDTTDRDNVTKGGPASYEEMCYSFVQYYPAQPAISLCWELTLGDDKDWASCTTVLELSQIQGQADIERLEQEGKIVPVASKDRTFKAYPPPACTPTKHRRSGVALAMTLVIVIPALLGVLGYGIYTVLARRRAAARGRYAYVEPRVEQQSLVGGGVKSSSGAV